MGRDSEFQNFLRTSFVHVPLFRRRRNLHLFDLRDDSSVRSALFFNYNRYFVSVSMCDSVESTTFVETFSAIFHVIKGIGT